MKPIRLGLVVGTAFSVAAILVGAVLAISLSLSRRSDGVFARHGLRRTGSPLVATPSGLCVDEEAHTYGDRCKAQTQAESELASPTRTFPSITSTRGLAALVGGYPMTQVVLTSLEGGQTVWESEGASGFTRLVGWDPSGDRLLYMRSVEGLAPYYGPRSWFRVASFLEGTDSIVSERGQPFVRAASWLRWLDDERVIAWDNEATSLTLVRVVTGEPVSIAIDVHVGGCDEYAFGRDCPKITSVATSTDAKVAVTLENGEVVVLGPDLAQIIRTVKPDAGECRAKAFSPEGGRVGVTCYRDLPNGGSLPPGDVTAWALDIPSKTWSKLASGKEFFEHSLEYFPWAPDGRRLVVEEWSSPRCGWPTYFGFLEPGKSMASPKFQGLFGSFSPDGRLVGFQNCSDEANGASFLARLDGSGRRQLAGGGEGPLLSPAR